MGVVAGTTPRESAEAGSVCLSLRFTVGSTGAVSAIVNSASSKIGGSPQSKGFKAQSAGSQQCVSRTGAGVYDILLDKPWLGLLHGHAHIVGAYTSTDGTKAYVTTDNVSNATTPKVSITFVADSTDAAADVKSGNDVIVSLVLKRDLP